MNTIVITIGRNIGNRPMAVVQWIDFKLAIEALIRDVGGKIIQKPEPYDGCQQGLWEGEREDAAAFIAFVHEWKLPVKGIVDWAEVQNVEVILRRRLSEIARRFEQKSIGFLICAGTQHLVHAA